MNNAIGDNPLRRWKVNLYADKGRASERKQLNLNNKSEVILGDDELKIIKCLERVDKVFLLLLTKVDCTQT